MTDVVLNADTITAIAATGEAFGAVTSAAIVGVGADGIVITSWKMAADATAPAFSSFNFGLAAARSAPLVFLPQTMINL